MSSDLDFALELADRAAAISAPAFARHEFSVTRKPDGSPVTDVDEAVERALREQIAAAHADHAVLGEEYGDSGESEWRWYLDPIDGTTRFVAGDPRWMTLIALARRGELTLGVVDFPALGERWWAAAGEGARHDGRAISVSSTGRLADAVVSDDWWGTLRRGGTDRPLARVAARARHIRPHDGNSLLAVASGQADVAIGVGGYPWDYAPLQVLVEQAGGRFTDFDGQPRFDLRQAVATNGRLHDQVLEALQTQG